MLYFSCPFYRLVAALSLMFGVPVHVFLPILIFLMRAPIKFSTALVKKQTNTWSNCHIIMIYYNFYLSTVCLSLFLTCNAALNLQSLVNRYTLLFDDAPLSLCNLPVTALTFARSIDCLGRACTRWIVHTWYIFHKASAHIEVFCTESNCVDLFQ